MSRTVACQDRQVSVCVRLVKASIDTYFLEDLAYGGCNQFGDDVADDKKEQEPHEVWEEPNQPVQNWPEILCEFHKNSFARRKAVSISVGKRLCQAPDIAPEGGFGNVRSAWRSPVNFPR